MSTGSSEPLHLATRCIHAGSRPSPGAPGVVPTIDRSTTFLQHPGTHELTDAGRWSEAWVYARYANPTVAAAERRLADLEGAEGSLLFGSGQAAMATALMACLAPGEAVAASAELYGGTVDLLENGIAPRGHRLERFAIASEDELARALDSGVRLVLVETLTNPTVKVADLPRISAQAKAAGALVLVDATFATPALQRPLEHGADVVMHSGTKAIAGHSDVSAGVLSTADPELYASLWKWRKRLGGVLDPDAAYLLDRGLRTMFLRVRAQCEGATALAAALEAHPDVAAVHHPSLASHPDHDLAAQLLDGPGSVLAFELAAGDGALRPFVGALHLATDAPSLGGVETLVSLPRYMSHPGLNDDQLRAAGIGPGTVRVALGIEHPQDLVRDFEQALAGLAPG